MIICKNIFNIYKLTKVKIVTYFLTLYLTKIMHKYDQII